MHAALGTCPTEELRLLVLQCKRNWQARSGEEHNWTMLQFLAQIDGEYYTRLQSLGQWGTTDANTTIVALQAAMAQKASCFEAYAQTFTAYKAAVYNKTTPNAVITSNTYQQTTFPRIYGHKKPDFTPHEGELLECKIEGLTNLWCAIFALYGLLLTPPLDMYAGPAETPKRASRHKYTKHPTTRAGYAPADSGNLENRAEQGRMMDF
jgi:hypothetical protein